MKSAIDHGYWANGFKFLCGLDEAGRGPWAGPVTAAAVILNPEEKINGINDSKKLAPEVREALFEEITAKAIAYAVISISNAVIDACNILEATKRAMQQAVKKLPVPPDFLLLDAVNINYPGIPQLAVIDGDAQSECIAAASILAKVTRDRYMLKMHDKHPTYNFRSNKGYGTAEHHEALKQYGPCPLHRRSFRPLCEMY